MNKEEDGMKVRLRRAALLLGAVAVVASVAVVFVAFVGSASGAAKKKYDIWVSYYNSSPYGIAQMKGAQAEAKVLGSSVTAATPNNDPHLQQTQLTDAITTGKYQGMVIAALDGHGLAPTIKQAEDKGIKVVVLDYTLGTLDQTKVLKATPGLVSTVGQGLGEQITGWGQELKKACAVKVGAGKPCSVAVMYGLANYPTDAFRTGVLKKMFATGPIKLLWMPPGNYDQATAQKVTLDYFQNKPHVDVFATFGDQMNAGADVAFKQLGLQPGKDFLEIGFGNTKQGIGWIKSGLWYASGAYYPTVGSKIAMKTLVDALNGKKVPTTINILHLPGTPLIIDRAFLKAHPNFKADWSL
jgi:ribose transport system substrate-binding protein